MYFVIAKKKGHQAHTKTFSNSAEKHFDNFMIFYKELDVYTNFKKLTFKRKLGLQEFH